MPNLLSVCILNLEALKAVVQVLNSAIDPDNVLPMYRFPSLLPVNPGLLPLEGQFWFARLLLSSVKPPLTDIDVKLKVSITSGLRACCRDEYNLYSCVPLPLTLEDILCNITFQSCPSFILL